VTWSAPEDDGGSPITGYNLEYMAIDGKKWVPASVDKLTETTLIVKRLKKNQEYLFRVCAENKVGAGLFSQNKEPIKIVAPLGELCLNVLCRVTFHQLLLFNRCLVKQCEWESMLFGLTGASATPKFVHLGNLILIFSLQSALHPSLRLVLMI
jgi:hypothetical protein